MKNKILSKVLFYERIFFFLRNMLSLVSVGGSGCFNSNYKGKKHRPTSPN